jgi:cobyrinic acid a,c-diamide synthase
MLASSHMPRVVVAGTSSGVGKTTVSVALARALATRGLRVAMFKCGPDYLDPTYHARAVRGDSQNLDGWMMGRDATLSTFASGARSADVAIVEGMMGLFDGAEPDGDRGSTAEVARWLDAPVLLVVDASAMARSIAPIAKGFAAFDPALRVAGVVANRVGGRGHLEMLKKALREPAIVGGLPGAPEQAFSERHLGLHAALEASVPEARFDYWGGLAADWLELDAILALARSAPALAIAEEPAPSAAWAASASPAPVRCRIGVARDEAFHFYYADNLRRLERLGARIVPFSPIADRQLPAVDGLYLGGGYPEVFAAELSANASMRESVGSFAASGRPVYAECGGLMYLTRAIVTVDGVRHAMAGVLPAEARMTPRIQAIGYVEVALETSCFLGAAGDRFRGHQFRCSELDPPPDDAAARRVYTIRPPDRPERTVREGFAVGNVVASYVHAHWASNPEVASAFVRACAGAAAHGTPRGKLGC